MSEFNEVEELLKKLDEDDLSLDKRYTYLREAYVTLGRAMGKARLELNKKYVADIRDAEEKRRMGRMLLGDKTDNTGVAQFKMIETMAGDAVVCEHSADRYVILGKIASLLHDLNQIL